MFGIDGLIGNVVNAGVSIIKSYFPPDLTPEQKAKLEAGLQQYQLEMNNELNEYSKTIIQEQSKIVQSEANGESWMQRNWRPVTMLTFVFIIANNYILYPYISLFGWEAVELVIPPDMWDLLKLGLSGYIVGRSVEKTVKVYKGK
jgi:hypothetical protein